jgi:hypothetical protein
LGRYLGQAIIAITGKEEHATTHISLSLSSLLFSSLLQSSSHQSLFFSVSFFFIIRLLFIFRSVSTSAAWSGERREFLGVGVFSIFGKFRFLCISSRGLEALVGEFYLSRRGT